MDSNSQKFGWVAISLFSVVPFLLFLFLYGLLLGRWGSKNKMNKCTPPSKPKLYPEKE
jgi:hypothetical protein